MQRKFFLQSFWTVQFERLETVVLDHPDAAVAQSRHHGLQSSGSQCGVHGQVMLHAPESFRADDLLFARTRLPLLHRAGRMFLGMAQNSPQRCL